MRHPRPVLLACVLTVLAAALGPTAYGVVCPAAAQDVAPAAPPRMAAGIADQLHGPGAFVRVACSAGCDATTKLTITYNMRVYLHLPSKSVGTGKGHLDGAGSIDILTDLTNRAIRAVRKRHGNQLPVTVQATAKDTQGRKSTLKKKLKIPL